MDKNSNGRRYSNTQKSIDGFINAIPKHHLTKEQLDRQKQTKRVLQIEEKKPEPIVPRVSPSTASGRTRLKKKNNKTKKIFIFSSLGVLAILIIFGGYIGLRALHSIDKVFHGNLISDTQALIRTEPLKGEDKGRVNILLAGDSADDPNHDGANLTDSIVVLSIDTKNHSAIMISIPRDLWVKIPGYGWQKINAANAALGTNFSGYPQNGMGQLEHIITNDLGIPINYYALANYTAFKDAVNDVGGVTVNIQSSNKYGLYDPYTNLKLPNGVISLNGQQALNLARSRGDGPGAYGFPNSDFDRTAHQRMLFTAIASKAMSLGVLSNPVKVGNLFNSFSNNVHTDLSLNNVLRLVQITKGMNLNNVQSYSYCSTMNATTCGKAIITGYHDPNTGVSALAPIEGVGNYTQLITFYNQLTSSNPIVKESPSVTIINSSEVTGLASSQRTKLSNLGYDVSAIADGNSSHPSTLIVDLTNGKKPNSLKSLQKLFPGTTTTNINLNTESKEASGYTSDFVIILGQNWQNTKKQ